MTSQPTRRKATTPKTTVVSTDEPAPVKTIEQAVALHCGHYKIVTQPAEWEPLVLGSSTLCRFCNADRDVTAVFFTQPGL